MARFRWPPGVEINWYNGRHNPVWTSKDRELDLEDSLPDFYPYLNAILGMTIDNKSRKWSYWTEKNLIYLEKWIREDICFDGHRMTMKRVCFIAGPCYEEFAWRLRILHVNHGVQKRLDRLDS